MANFLSMYKSLNRDNLHILKTVYTEDVRFIDPAHEINGLEHLTNYFSALYQNLDSIDFSFHHSSMIKTKAMSSGT